MSASWVRIRISNSSGPVEQWSSWNGSNRLRVTGVPEQNCDWILPPKLWRSKTDFAAFGSFSRTGLEKVSISICPSRGERAAELDRTGRGLDADRGNRLAGGDDLAAHRLDLDLAARPFDGDRAADRGQVHRHARRLDVDRAGHRFDFDRGARAGDANGSVHGLHLDLAGDRIHRDRRR